MEPDRIGHIPQIGGDTELDPLGPQAVTNRIPSIVRNREAVNFDVPDPQRRPGLEQLKLGGVAEPFDRGRGKPCHVNRDVQLSGDARESAYVIGMLMGDEDCVEPQRILADGEQPFASVAITQPRVDEQARTVGGDERRVSRTTAGEGADPYDTCLQTSFCNKNWPKQQGVILFKSYVNLSFVYDSV